MKITTNSHGILKIYKLLKDEDSVTAKLSVYVIKPN